MILKHTDDPIVRAIADLTGATVATSADALAPILDPPSILEDAPWLEDETGSAGIYGIGIMLILAGMAYLAVHAVAWVVGGMGRVVGSW